MMPFSLKKNEKAAGFFLNKEERNALTHCYVICRGYNVISGNGALAGYIRNAYPQAGFDLLAEAFSDAVKGEFGPSATKIDRLTNSASAHKQRLRNLSKAIQNFK